MFRAAAWVTTAMLGASVWYWRSSSMKSAIASVLWLPCLTDVVFAQNEIALLFDRARRGHSCEKEGEQGVHLDMAHAMAAVSKLIKDKKPNDRVLGICNAVYRNWWKWFAASCSCKLPPHAGRHLGAGRDAATGYRPIEQIQRRGRWEVPASVR